MEFPGPGGVEPIETVCMKGRAVWARLWVSFFFSLLNVVCMMVYVLLVRKTALFSFFLCS